MTITEKPASEVMRDALESIALAGMSGTGQESEEGMTAWHARRAWEFIGIAARALTAANAVSHPKPETAPPPEGGAITSESAADAVSDMGNPITDFDKLRDPAILHANLLRGFPALLTPEQLWHLIGEVQQKALIAKFGEPQAQGEAINDACEVLATVMHFIPPSEPKLMQDVSALCHNLRTHAHPQATEPEWIAVSDRLPEENKRVLVWYRGHVSTTSLWLGSFITDSSAQPTHWMPLPSPPEAKQ